MVDINRTVFEYILRVRHRQRPVYYFLLIFVYEFIFVCTYHLYICECGWVCKIVCVMYYVFTTNVCGNGYHLKCNAIRLSRCT